jgi:hypothetical protein
MGKINENNFTGNRSIESTERNKSLDLIAQSAQPLNPIPPQKASMQGKTKRINKSLELKFVESGAGISGLRVKTNFSEIPVGKGSLGFSGSVTGARGVQKNVDVSRSIVNFAVGYSEKHQLNPSISIKYGFAQDIEFTLPIQGKSSTSSETSASVNVTKKLSPTSALSAGITTSLYNSSDLQFRNSANLRYEQKMGDVYAGIGLRGGNQTHLNGMNAGKNFFHAAITADISTNLSESVKGSVFAANTFSSNTTSLDPNSIKSPGLSFGATVEIKF